MKLYSLLPATRAEEGQFWIEDADGARIYGFVRCRGEADNAGALKHGNVQEDPTRAFGDHPFGLYRVTRIVEHPEPKESYGPAFIAINPVAGEAWTARENGRSGFGIHGGRQHDDGRLRETHGCLRVDDDTAEAIVALLDIERGSGREVFYEAREA